MPNRLTEDIFHLVNIQEDLRIHQWNDKINFYRPESLSSLPPKIWELITQSLKRPNWNIKI